MKEPALVDGAFVGQMPPASMTCRTCGKPKWEPGPYPGWFRPVAHPCDTKDGELDLWTKLAFRLMDLIPPKSIDAARACWADLNEYYDERDLYESSRAKEASHPGSQGAPKEEA